MRRPSHGFGPCRCRCHGGRNFVLDGADEVRLRGRDCVVCASDRRLFGERIRRAFPEHPNDCHACGGSMFTPTLPCVRVFGGPRPVMTNRNYHGVVGRAA